MSEHGLTTTPKLCHPEYSSKIQELNTHTVFKAVKCLQGDFSSPAPPPHPTHPRCCTLCLSEVVLKLSCCCRGSGHIYIVSGLFGLFLNWKHLTLPTRGVECVCCCLKGEVAFFYSLQACIFTFNKE